MASAASKVLSRIKATYTRAGGQANVSTGSGKKSGGSTGTKKGSTFKSTVALTGKTALQKGAVKARNARVRNQAQNASFAAGARSLIG